MRNAGVLERLSRGLYRIAELPPLGNPDLVAVALKVPIGVICLISALAYHELTTQIPHEVYMALPRGKSDTSLPSGTAVTQLHTENDLCTDRG